MERGKLVLTVRQSRVRPRSEEETRARGAGVPVHRCLKGGAVSAAEVIDGGSGGVLEPQESGEARSVPPAGCSVECSPAGKAGTEFDLPFAVKQATKGQSLKP